MDFLGPSLRKMFGLRMVAHGNLEKILDSQIYLEVSMPGCPGIGKNAQAVFWNLFRFCRSWLTKVRKEDDICHNFPKDFIVTSFTVENVALGPTLRPNHFGWLTSQPSTEKFSWHLRTILVLKSNHYSV